MLENKINVLVIPSDNMGVGNFRSINPHVNLEKIYPEEFNTDIEFNPDLYNDEFLKKYNIIHFHKRINNYQDLDNLFERFKKFNIITIMDLDDHWQYHEHHPNYSINQIVREDLKITDLLRRVDYVTVTTDKLASEVSGYNRNTKVIPNSIDSTEAQYISNKEQSDRIRFGWLGGSTHFHSLKMLNGVVDLLHKDNLLDKIQFVLCGFDTNGIIRYYENGQLKQRKPTPTESPYFKFEQIFTSNYSSISREYKNQLLMFNKNEYSDVKNEAYRRVWTKPLNTYASGYNLFDVSLAPLENNFHNQAKSQLKVIEAGFHKTPIIVSHITPYLIDIKDMENGIIVDRKAKEYGWYEAIKYFIENPNEIKRMGDNLFETVNEKYEIKVVSKIRADFYKEILKNNEKIN